MKVDFDTSALEASMLANERAMRTGAINQEIRAVVRESAAQLRRTDTYQNRTGLLRKRTRIRREPGATVLEMATEYAHFVVRRGFSFWDDVVTKTKTAVDERVRKYVKDTIK